MNKNITLGTIASVVTVGSILIIGWLQYSLSPSPALPQIDSAVIEKDLSDLNALSSELAISDFDDAVGGEIDLALDEVGEIRSATILNEEVAGLDNLSNDLTAISEEEASLRELDQALGEATAN